MASYSAIGSHPGHPGTLNSVMANLPQALQCNALIDPGSECGKRHKLSQPVSQSDVRLTRLSRGWPVQ